MIRAAIGHATLPPCSPPCTITAIVYLGLSKGAQQTNQEIVSSLPLYFAWAVPVLPATFTPDKRARLPVPPSAFTTFQNPCRSNSISAGGNNCGKNTLTVGDCRMRALGRLVTSESGVLFLSPFRPREDSKK